jgi:hypothetical protein
LVFASDLPGGFGGKDLWYTTYDKKSDSWSTPINMGAGINTPGNELFPTLALNGDLLYASDGLPGVGGLDIFRAAKIGDENKWENPTNLGMPINSEFNDYALIEHDDKKGYFTSERRKGDKDNKADIWNYVMPPNLFDLTVNVGEVGDMTKKKRVADLPVYVVGTNGEKWEGVYVELRNVSVYNDRAASGASRWTWSVTDKSGNAISIRDYSGYYRNDAFTADSVFGANNKRFTPPPIGKSFAYLRGVIQEYSLQGATRYGIAPLYTNDLGPALYTPPTIAARARTPVAPSSSDSIRFTYKIQQNDALDTAIQNNLNYICAETLTGDLQVVQNLSAATANSVEVDELVSTLISIEKLN